jgi:hypothetical protein
LITVTIILSLYYRVNTASNEIHFISRDCFYINTKSKSPETTSNLKVPIPTPTPLAQKEHKGEEHEESEESHRPEIILVEENCTDCLSLSSPMDPQLIEGDREVKEVRGHDEKVTENLVKKPLSENDVPNELIPARGEDVEEGNVGDDEHGKGCNWLPSIKEPKHAHCGNELGNGEEELVGPLVIEVVVPVVPCHPPGIVVGVEGAEEEEAHCAPELPLEKETNDSFEALVYRDEGYHGEGPHFKRVPGAVEVDVLVVGDTGLVRA